VKENRVVDENNGSNEIVEVDKTFIFPLPGRSVLFESL